ncbi:MAG: peptidylprolyl isomerase [Bryobacteraceae bacterium]|nr:peptidylprolyl isomerase [Bryobacteraceae bacterium]
MKFSALFTLILTASVFVSAQTKPATSAPASKPRPVAAPSKPSAPMSSAEDTKVVMTFGDQKITAKEFDRLIDALPDQYRAQARGPMKRQMAEQIARVMMLAAEARKRGLDKDAQTQSRIRFQEDNLLAGVTYNDMVQKMSVDDAMIQKYYDEHKNEFETVQARHILVKFKGSPVPTREGKAELSEEQALAKVQELKKQLAGGSDFAALAKAESDDAGSGANGGELGSFPRGQMVPAFDEIAFKLPVAEVSEPVKTQFGYHLIRVDKHETRTLAEVKGELSGKLKPEAARKAVEDLQKAANLKLDDAYFGPVPAAPAPGIVPAPGAPGAPAPPAPPAQ